MTSPGPSRPRIAFAASDRPEAQTACARLAARYGSASQETADVIVALGGDGFMLETVHALIHSGKPIYGMNKGSVGFLMNEFADDDLLGRINAQLHRQNEPSQPPAERRRL